MIFHTINTITIGRFADMERENDISYLKKINVWCPKGILNRKHKELIIEYNKLTNAKGIDKILTKGIHKLKMLNLINVQYSMMLNLLDLIAKFGNKGFKTTLDNIYLNVYGKFPDKKEDYKRIKKDAKLLERKFNQQNQDQDESKPVSFEKILTNIEELLPNTNIRDKKLSNFTIYTDLATEKLKDNG